MNEKKKEPFFHKNGFRGVAEDLGITNDDDIVEMVKEIRKERENKQKRS